MNVSGEEEEEKYLRDPTHCALNLLMLSGGEEEIVEEDFLSSEIFYCQMAGDSLGISLRQSIEMGRAGFFFLSFPDFFWAYSSILNWKKSRDDKVKSS
jgi:hypothetical protein